MVDLYSGLGGASEAMYRSGEWEVLRIESNWDLLGEVPKTWFFDVTRLLESGNYLSVEKHMDLLWASPPCTEFSMGYNAPAPKAAREGREFFPDLSLVEAAIHLREIWQPKYWVIENVIGSIKHLEPLLGEPTQIIGPFVLWTNLPQIIMSSDFEHESKTKLSGSNPMSANLRAKIPIELSEAVMAAATAPTLGDYV
tara:strand:- start:638 stop:1228 length:591 start_codon:yes stop_codon:yes gene_type:complete